MKVLLKGYCCGLRFLGMTKDKHFTLFTDNQSAIHIATQPGFTARTKHIDLRFHFLKDEIAKKRISLSHLPTAEMPADFLTKPLNNTNFHKGIALAGMTTNFNCPPSQFSA